MIGVSARVSSPTLDAWRTKLAGGVGQRIATRAARRVQHQVADTAPYQTGALAQSVAVQTVEDSDYGERVETVLALNPAATVFPEPAPPAGPDAATATSVVEYATYVNGGTIHQAAQPFWDQAVLDAGAALGADAETEWQAAP